ncbi:MAG: glycosyltransferase [Muribaculum sp.]|nr:glycosyltransferase [Muribaculum sp.]
MKTIFIGPYSKGRVPNDGASIKNYHILNKLRTLLPDLIEIDTDGWKRKPWILIKILWFVASNRRSKFILSLNSDSANKLIRVIRAVAPDAELIYWVIGGSIGNWLIEGRVKKDNYVWLKNIIVEGESMKSQFESVGLHNVSVMPNFKKLVAINSSIKEVTPVRFLFLSRINEMKGCDIILESAKRLNQSGYLAKYSIDFYGPIEHGYRDHFMSEIETLCNVEYKGFIDLRNAENYNIVAQYNAMLFPTFWHGEGCPGIIIDAYMCGLPVLASEWNLNADYVNDRKTGLLFEAKSVTSLVDAMARCIRGEIDLEELSGNAKVAAKSYDIDKVLSFDNLKKNHLIG